MDERFFERLASAVLELRGDRSQRTFSKIIGVSQAAVQGWENKQGLPNLENLEKLATLRGERVEVFIAYLYGRPFGESVPLDQQVQGMTLEKIADLNEAIARRLRGNPKS